MSVREIKDSVERWMREGRTCGVATLVRVERTAPRRPGARFAVGRPGEMAGSISSGCVEADLAERIRQVLDDGRPGIVSYGITEEMAAEVGLACGGRIEVFIDVHRPDPAWERLCRALDEGEPAVLVTALASPEPGRRALFLSDGSVVGEFPDALDAELGSRIEPLFRGGGTSIVTAGGEDSEFFAEAFLPPPRVAIVGATPIAEALTRYACRLGYSVTVIDPRDGLATAEKFPGARVRVEWPDEGLRDMQADARTSVAVLAHDHKLDVPALAEALRAGCRYVGLLGGRRTQERRRDALREMGLPEEAIRRVRGPIGLSIGAVEPEEIALSIAAELVAFRTEARAAGP